MPTYEANLTDPTPNTQIILRKAGTTPLSHDEVDGNFVYLMDGLNDLDVALGTKAASSHTHSAATASSAGFMSTTDKSKLDGIAASANNYSLPAATSSSLGGVKVGTGISVSSGTISVANATTSVPGLMSSSDKTKLNGIATSANNYSLPTASSGTLGGIKVGSGLSISNGTLSADTQSGTYSLPTASSGTLGGVKIGNGITISSGVISVKSNDSAINVASTGLTLDKASSSAYGVVKIGSGISVNNGEISVSNTSYSLPTASAETLGGVKVGSGLSINSGVLSATAQTTNAMYDGVGIFARTLAKSNTSYYSDSGNNLVRRDSEAANSTDASNPHADTMLKVNGATVHVEDNELYVAHGQKKLRVYLDAVRGVDISKDNAGNTVTDPYGNSNTQGGVGNYQFRGVVGDPIDSRYDTIPQAFINYGQAKAYLQFHHLGVKDVEFWFLTDITETLYPYSSGAAPHDATYFKEKLFTPYIGGTRSVKQWNITFAGGRTFLHYATENIVFQDLSINISAPDGFSHVSCVTGGKYLYLGGYVSVYVDRWAEIGIWCASRNSQIYDFSMGDYRIGNTGANATSVFPTYLYAADASIVKEASSYGNGLYNHGGYAKRFDGNWGTCKLANGSTFTTNPFNIPHHGSADDPSIMGWPNNAGDIGPVEKIVTDGGSSERVYPAIGPFTQITGARQLFDPLTKAYQVPAFLSYGVGNVAGYSNVTEFSGSTIEMEPVAIDAYTFTPVMGDYTWGSTFNANMPDGWHQALQTSQSSLANFPMTIVNPIHSSQAALPPPKKGRYFHFYKHGYAGFDNFNPTAVGDNTSSHAVNANGDSFNRYFPATPNFHANENSWIPTANFA